MEEPKKGLARFRQILKMIFCRHRNKRPFVIRAGHDLNNLEVIARNIQCVRCGCQWEATYE